MRPETAAYLQKAHEFLTKAQGMFDQQWPDEAGRAAYLAGLHAARAFIFENTGEITKSHRRAQSELTRLTKDDPRFDLELRGFLGLELRGFLGRTFNFKVFADYDTAPGSQVSAESAREAMRTAARFVASVASLVSVDGQMSPVDNRPKS